NIIAPVWAAVNIASAPNVHSSKRFLLAFFWTAVLTISVCGLHPTMAQVTVATDPVGFTTTSLLGNSDTYVSILFTRQPEFVAGISSAATSGTTGIIRSPATLGLRINLCMAALSTTTITLSSVQSAEREQKKDTHT